MILCSKGAINSGSSSAVLVVSTSGCVCVCACVCVCVCVCVLLCCEEASHMMSMILVFAVGAGTGEW